MPEFLKKFLTELNDSDKSKVADWLKGIDYEQPYDDIEACVTSLEEDN